MFSGYREATSMSWVPRDCHAHTTFSDGELEPAELIVRVRTRGVRPSISDHATHDTTHGLTSIEAVRVYLDALDDLHDEDLGRAAEFCWHDSLWRELPEDLTRRFTHRLGSLHAIPLPDGSLLDMFGTDFPVGLTPDAYMNIHVAAVEHFAREMPVDIWAHPTLLPVAIRAIPLEELWTEQREERAVAAIRAAGIAFEVSNRYRAHERFVRRAQDSGVRLSLGSDGHVPSGVGDILWPLALARSVGARDDELYDPMVHGSRTAGAPRAASTAA
jgi:histidinol phosphatase-like PHP family hydrolase